MLSAVATMTIKNMVVVRCSFVCNHQLRLAHPSHPSWVNCVMILPTCMEEFVVVAVAIVVVVIVVVVVVIFIVRVMVMVVVVVVVVVAVAVAIVW